MGIQTSVVRIEDRRLLIIWRRSPTGWIRLRPLSIAADGDIRQWRAYYLRERREGKTRFRFTRWLVEYGFASEITDGFTVIRDPVNKD